MNDLPKDVTNAATFRDALASRYGDLFKVSGRIKNINKIADFECENGHIFRKLPSELLSKGICPKCPRTKSNDRYKTDLKAARGDDLIVLEPYKNTNTKILHKCTHCEQERAIKPYDALGSRYYCPNCGFGRGLTTENDDEISILKYFRNLSDEQRNLFLSSLK
jgi:hypothetical protein